jgi:hypothetical protein
VSDVATARNWAERVRQDMSKKGLDLEGSSMPIRLADQNERWRTRWKGQVPRRQV